MFDVTYGGAFLAGLLSFVSPCVLPIVPPYMAYLAGLTFDELQDERRDAEATRQLIRAAVGFVLGFSTVFVALGATASLIGARKHVVEGKGVSGRVVFCRRRHNK